MARSGRPVAREAARFVWLAEGRVRQLAGVRRGIGRRREDRLAARRLLEYRRLEVLLQRES